jgi:sulfur carrier protein ThiS
VNLQQGPLDGEIILPARELVGTVRVVGYLHPLRQERIDFAHPAGSSLAELIEAAKTRGRISKLAQLAVQVDGQAVPQEWWPRIRPRAGHLVTFIPRVHGDSTRTIIALAIVVVAMVIAPYAAQWAWFAIGGTMLAPAWFTAAVGSTIALGGTLALNAAFPIRSPQLREPNSKGFKSLAAIQGGSNQINKYGSVPVILGTHRFYGPFGVKPITEIVGDDQYLRVMVIWGYGPLTISDLRIGETPLDQFEDVEVESANGYASDNPSTLIPRDIDEEQLSVELSYGVEVIRQTNPDTDEFSIDLTAPEGIFEVINATGNYRAKEVQVAYSYRLVGAGAWTDWVTITLRRELKTARRGRRAKPGARGQWEIRAVKLTIDHSSTDIRDKVVWTALRSIHNRHPILFPKPLAWTALRIRASDQLSGVVDSINAVLKTRCTAFDGAAWNEDTKLAPVESNWPPDLYRHVLQGPAQARTKTDEEIDLDTLQAWRAFCVENGFHFNQVRDSVRGTWDQLQDICSAGRAVVLHKDGRWSVAWDQPDDVIRQHFTPKNAWALTLQKVFAEETHGWRVPFINEAKGYAEDERTVYDDGYSEANATKFEQIEFPGVTATEEIWKHGRYAIAQIRLRPDTISFMTDWEGLTCTRGDRIYLAYDVLRIGQVSGYVKGSGTDPDTGVHFIDLDETVLMDPDKLYALRFRGADGFSVLRSVVTEAGELRRVHLAGLDDLPAEGMLYSFGEANREAGVFRLKMIENQENLFARLTVVDDAPAIANADKGPIPDYDPGISDPVDPLTQAPANLSVIEWLERQGGAVRSLAKLSWQIARVGKIAFTQVQKRDDGAGEGWRNALPPVPAPETSAVFPIDAAGTWSFRARHLFADGTVSAWSALEGVSMLGLNTPPADVKNLRRTYVSANSTLDWDEIQDPRAIHYEVRRGLTPDTAMTVADQLAQPRYATVGDGTYWIAAYVLSGFGERIYSTTWSSAVLEDSVLTKNVIVSHNEQAEGFTGNLEGGAVVSGVIVANGDPIVSDWAQQILDDIGLTEGERIFVYRSAHQVDILRAASCPLNIIWDGAGAEIGADFLGIADLLAQQDLLGQALSRFIRVIPVVRESASAAVDAFAAADAFDAADAFADVSWGPWRPFSPGGYMGRLFQAGLVGVSTDAGINPICPAFTWEVDVPDRVDHYNDLTVPDTGYAITFQPDGAAAAAPFNGGPNGLAVPVIGKSILNPTAGDEIQISALTANGCTVKVWNNNSSTYVTRAGVYIQAAGF